jgi:hypothetical protein
VRGGLCEREVRERTPSACGPPSPRENPLSPSSNKILPRPGLPFFQHGLYLSKSQMRLHQQQSLKSSSRQRHRCDQCVDASKTEVWSRGISESLGPFFNYLCGKNEIKSSEEIAYSSDEQQFQQFQRKWSFRKWSSPPLPLKT